jgi:hypothetical protein
VTDCQLRWRRRATTQRPESIAALFRQAIIEMQNSRRLPIISSSSPPGRQPHIGRSKEGLGPCLLHLMLVVAFVSTIAREGPLLAAVEELAGFEGTAPFYRPAPININKKPWLLEPEDLRCTCIVQAPWQTDRYRYRIGIVDSSGMLIVTKVDSPESNWSRANHHHFDHRADSAPAPNPRCRAKRPIQ